MKNFHANRVGWIVGLSILCLEVCPLAGQAGSPTVLGIDGTQFTLNGRPAFLFGLSYYGALGASDTFWAQDFEDMRRYGFNWVRVWATWRSFSNDVSAVDADGNSREPFLSRLKELLAKCDGRGMVVDLTLSRGDGAVGSPRLQNLSAHRRAVETLVMALKRYRNWYLDLSNERNIRDHRFTSVNDLKELRELARNLDPGRLVTASHGGDISREELRQYLETARLDFITPHRPREPASPSQTAAKTPEYFRWMKEIGRVVPVHYQEPFRRGYAQWQPSAADFITDARNARSSGAAGWCFHNGPEQGRPGSQPRRSFDLRAARLFAQLDELERQAMEGLISGAVYNVTLATANAPDLTDIDSYLRSITSQYSNPQDQAISIWRWSQRLRKQTTNPIEEGHFVLDPIRMFNSYGYCNCGIISGVNDALWLRMGWKAHYVQLGDHTVCECSWDGGKKWHMFDSSMSFYCFNDQGEVASVREIERNPRFYLENFAPECGTNPVRGPDDHRGWRCASDHPVEYQRTLANGYDSFKPPNDIQEGNLLAQWGSRYVLNLRPNEQYTRYFDRLEMGGPRTFRPVRNQQDPDPNKTFRANGVWHYTPDLRDPATRDFIYSESGVSWTAEGIKGPGFVIFKISAANVVTSAKLSLNSSNASVSVSRDAGINWEKVALNSGEAECLEQIAGVTEYLVKADLGGPEALLSSLQIDTITQLNRPALPKLVRGANRIQVRLGPQVETIQFQPSIVAGNHKRTVYAEKGLDVESQPDFYKPTLRPAEKGIPCHATWRIEAPTPVTDLVFGGTVCVKGPKDRVTLLHSWDDQAYLRDYEKANGSMPFDLMVNATVASVPAGIRTAYLRYEFQTEQYPKHYFGPGIQTAAMLVHHQPRNATFVPFEVTYCWVEHRDTGEVERRHCELVTSTPHEYEINVGGFRDPTMKWVRMNLKGHRPGAEKVTYGYTGEPEAGPAVTTPWVRYRWGTNLALGKPYTLEGKQDERNPDAGHDLTDGIIAPPDTYVSAKYMPTYVMFSKDVSPVVTIDLGSSQSVSAVRVHAGQEGGFHLSYPNRITAETSTDGKTFAPAWFAPFDQVFAPPAGFVPWELEDAATFSALPAGGRLAYAYRIIFPRPVSARYVRVQCDARKGWGMLLSEVQVFDKVMVDQNVPPLVALPPIQNP